MINEPATDDTEVNNGDNTSADDNSSDDDTSADDTTLTDDNTPPELPNSKDDLVNMDEIMGEIKTLRQWILDLQVFQSFGVGWWDQGH